MNRKILENKMGKAFEEMEWSVDWSETDGSDVKEILETYISRKTIKENLDTLIDIVSEIPKKHPMNKWEQELICQMLGGKKGTFIKD